MLLEFVLLAQAAAARPVPSPTVSPAAVATPSGKLGGGFGAPAAQKPTTGKARVVITDAALAPAPTTKSGTFNVAGTRGAPTPPATAAAGTSSDGSPSPGDDEAAWKGRVAGLRAALAQAQKDLDAADAANTVVAWGNLGHDYEMLMAVRNSALAPYRMKVQEIKRELAGLPEECRKTVGCQPGWVR